MKHKSIVIGSIIACFMLLMVPHISAIQYHTVVNDIKQEFSFNNFDRVEDIQKENTILLNEERIKEMVNNDNLPSPLWIFYLLCFAFLTIINIIEADYFDALRSFTGFAISLIIIIEDFLIPKIDIKS